MFQPLKGHYQGVRTVTDICTYMHTSCTSVHRECEAVYDDTGVGSQCYAVKGSDVSSVYIFIFFGQKHDDCQSLLFTN